MPSRPDDAGGGPVDADEATDADELRQRVEGLPVASGDPERADFFALFARILLDVYAASRLPRPLGNSPPPSGAEGWPDPQEAEGQALRHLEVAATTASAVRAVAYLRRSTRDQAQSLERQRHEIERHAAANGIEVVRWYMDDGVSGVEDAARPGFQQMVADAERLRDFDVILVHEISRFGRFDAFQSGSWLHRLKAARVRVQALEGSVKDPYSVQGKLLLALEQDRQESVKLSMRTLSGQRETASKGLRAGGKVPYGYARSRRRVDGTTEILGRVGRAKRDKSEVIELVPGDPIEVEAVQSIFRWTLDGCGYRTIAQRLNDRGMPSPDVARRRTIATTPGRWVSTTIRALLLNPVYTGDAIWNVRS